MPLPLIASIPSHSFTRFCSHPIALVPLFVAAMYLAPVGAAAAPLTLPQAQHLAIARSRQLPAQDLVIKSSREMAVAAGQLPDPVLRLGVDNLPVNGGDRLSLTKDFMTMRRIGLSQEIVRADKRQLRSERFEREADKSIAEKEKTIAGIERDTAIAWLDRYYAEQMVAVIAEQAAQAQQEIQAAEGAYRSGRATQADVFAARSALASVDDRRSEMQSRVRNAITMLERWTGEDAAAQLVGQPDVDTINLDPVTLATQLAKHPDIALLRKQEEIARAEVRLAQANKKPDWNVEVSYSQRGPAYSNMVSVGVSVPLGRR